MKRFTPLPFMAMLLAGALVLAGCAETQQDTALETDTTDPAMGATDATTAPEIQAVAQIEPTEGNDVSGTVTFTSTDGAVRVMADLQGLTEGQHGFHVHENGDCSAPDASSAGGHYNPHDDIHGAPTDPMSEHHTGDMGNLIADASGAAHLETTFDFLPLQGDSSIVGQAVIVHGGADDLTSQPSGAAGPRVGCGIIEMASGGMTDTTGGMMNDSM